MKDRAEYLKILGLTDTATQNDLKDAYKKKMKECHPDKHRDNLVDATAKTQIINEAKDFLEPLLPKVAKGIDSEAMALAPPSLIYEYQQIQNKVIELENFLAPVSVTATSVPDTKNTVLTSYSFDVTLSKKALASYLLELKNKRADLVKLINKYKISKGLPTEEDIFNMLKDELSTSAKELQEALDFLKAQIDEEIDANLKIGIAVKTLDEVNFRLNPTQTDKGDSKSVDSNSSTKDVVASVSNPPHKLSHRQLLEELQINHAKLQKEVDRIKANQHQRKLLAAEKEEATRLEQKYVEFSTKQQEIQKAEDQTVAKEIAQQIQDRQNNIAQAKLRFKILNNLSEINYYIEDMLGLPAWLIEYTDLHHRRAELLASDSMTTHLNTTIANIDRLIEDLKPKSVQPTIVTTGNVAEVKSSLPVASNTVAKDSKNDEKHNIAPNSNLKTLQSPEAGALLVVMTFNRLVQHYSLGLGKAIKVANEGTNNRNKYRRRGNVAPPAHTKVAQAVSKSTLVNNLSHSELQESLTRAKLLFRHNLCVFKNKKTAENLLEADEKNIDDAKNYNDQLPDELKDIPDFLKDEFTIVLYAKDEPLPKNNISEHKMFIMQQISGTKIQVCVWRPLSKSDPDKGLQYLEKEITLTPEQFVLLPFPKTLQQGRLNTDNNRESPVLALHPQSESKNSVDLEKLVDDIAIECGFEIKAHKPEVASAAKLENDKGDAKSESPIAQQKDQEAFTMVQTLMGQRKITVVKAPPPLPVKKQIYNNWDRLSSIVQKHKASLEKDASESKRKLATDNLELKRIEALRKEQQSVVGQTEAAKLTRKKIAAEIQARIEMKEEAENSQNPLLNSLELLLKIRTYLTAHPGLLQNFAPRDVLGPLVDMTKPVVTIIFQYYGLDPFVMSQQGHPDIRKDLSLWLTENVTLTNEIREREQKKSQDKGLTELDTQIAEFQQAFPGIDEWYLNLQATGQANRITSATAQGRYNGYHVTNQTPEKFIKFVTNFYPFLFQLRGCAQLSPLFLMEDGFKVEVVWSSTDFQKNEQPKQGGIWVMRTGGFTAICLVRNGNRWLRVMNCFGMTDELFQALFNTLKKPLDPKYDLSTAKFTEVGGSDELRSVSKAKLDATKIILNFTLPHMPVSPISTSVTAILGESFQGAKYTDLYAVRVTRPDQFGKNCYAVYNQRSLDDGSHTGDRKREGSSIYNFHYFLQPVNHKKIKEASLTLYVISSYRQHIDKTPRQAYISLISPTQAQLSELKREITGSGPISLKCQQKVNELKKEGNVIYDCPSLMAFADELTPQQIAENLAVQNENDQTIANNRNLPAAQRKILRQKPHGNDGIVIYGVYACPRHNRWINVQITMPLTIDLDINNVENFNLWAYTYFMPMIESKDFQNRIDDSIKEEKIKIAKQDRIRELSHPHIGKPYEKMMPVFLELTTTLTTLKGVIEPMVKQLQDEKSDIDQLEYDLPNNARVALLDARKENELTKKTNKDHPDLDTRRFLTQFFSAQLTEVQKKYETLLVQFSAVALPPVTFRNQFKKVSPFGVYTKSISELEKDKKVAGQTAADEKDPRKQTVLNQLREILVTYAEIGRQEIIPIFLETVQILSDLKSMITDKKQNTDEYKEREKQFHASLHSFAEHDFVKKNDLTKLGPLPLPRDDLGNDDEGFHMDFIGVGIELQNNLFNKAFNRFHEFYVALLKEHIPVNEEFNENLFNQLRQKKNIQAKLAKNNAFFRSAPMIPNLEGSCGDYKRSAPEIPNPKDSQGDHKALDLVPIPAAQPANFKISPDTYVELFVDTYSKSTQVFPKEDETIPQYYAWCIVKASQFLDDTAKRRQQALSWFIQAMKKHHKTEQLLQNINASLVKVDNDEQLLNQLRASLVKGPAALPALLEFKNDKNAMISVAIKSSSNQGNTLEHYAWSIASCLTHLDDTPTGLREAVACFVTAMNSVPETKKILQSFAKDFNDKGIKKDEELLTYLCQHLAKTVAATNNPDKLMTLTMTSPHRLFKKMRSLPSRNVQIVQTGHVHKSLN